MRFEFVSTLTTLEFVVYIAHAELRVYIEVSRFDRVEYLKRNMMSLAYMYDCKAFAILTFFNIGHSNARARQHFDILRIGGTCLRFCPCTH